MGLLVTFGFHHWQVEDGCDFSQILSSDCSSCKAFSEIVNSLIRADLAEAGPIPRGVSIQKPSLPIFIS